MYYPDAVKKNDTNDEDKDEAPDLGLVGDKGLSNGEFRCEITGDTTDKEEGVVSRISGAVWRPVSGGVVEWKGAGAEGDDAVGKEAVLGHVILVLDVEDIRWRKGGNLNGREEIENSNVLKT